MLDKESRGMLVSLNSLQSELTSRVSIVRAADESVVSEDAAGANNVSEGCMLGVCACAVLALPLTTAASVVSCMGEDEEKAKAGEVTPSKGWREELLVGELEKIPPEFRPGSVDTVDTEDISKTSSVD